MFRINTPFFQTQLLDLVPLITTTADTTSTRKRIGEHKRHYKEGLLELSGINLAFSQKGLTALGIDDDLDDEGFKKGMLNDATGDGGLGDDLDNWDERFKGDIHGVLLITANDEVKRDETVEQMKGIYSKLTNLRLVSLSCFNSMAKSDLELKMDMSSECLPVSSSRGPAHQSLQFRIQ